MCDCCFCLFICVVAVTCCSWYLLSFVNKIPTLEIMQLSSMLLYRYVYLFLLFCFLLNHHCITVCIHQGSSGLQSMERVRHVPLDGELHPGRLTWFTWEYGPPEKRKIVWTKPWCSGSMLIFHDVTVRAYNNPMFKHHLQSPHVYPSSAGWSHKTCNGDSTQQHQNKTFYHKQQSQTWIY